MGTYSRREVTDHVTVMNKELYDNLQDGIDESLSKVKELETGQSNMEKSLTKQSETLSSLTKDFQQQNNKIKEMSTSVEDTKPIILINVSVDVSLWLEDSTYSDYPYKADIPCEGVTAEYVADVTFDLTEATSGVYAPICITGNGIVSIYATEIPTDTIVIPVIKCVKAVA